MLSKVMIINGNLELAVQLVVEQITLEMTLALTLTDQQHRLVEMKLDLKILT
jgi:hypothetical protein